MPGTAVTGSHPDHRGRPEGHRGGTPRGIGPVGAARMERVAGRMVMELARMEWEPHRVLHRVLHRRAGQRQF